LKPFENPLSAVLPSVVCRLYPTIVLWEAKPSLDSIRPSVVESQAELEQKQVWAGFPRRCSSSQRRQPKKA